MSAEAIQKTDKKTIPDFKPGDTVRVHLKVVEGESERIQVFEGTVLRRRGSGISETFTVRKISFGVGVERTFPLLSPRIQKLEMARSGRSRRSRLYYLRNVSGKAAKLSEDTRGSKAASSDGAKDSQPSGSADSAPETPPKVETAPAA